MPAATPAAMPPVPDGSGERSRFDIGLERNLANFAALTPRTLLDWAADVYPHVCAVVHGALRISWSEQRARARRLASAMSARGVKAGDSVAVMLPNIPAMLDAHHGVPLLGAVLNSINTRLDAATVAFILDHSESSVLIVDREYSVCAADALERLRAQGRPVPWVVDVDDPLYDGPGQRVGAIGYEELLAEGDPQAEFPPLADEWHAIGLNYTSGTTGNPKGVVVHHRGAYLNALGNIVAWNLPRHPVYLWTLPMFHCNGWCFPWTLAAVAGTNVCLRRVDAANIFALMREHRVSHYCGAPIVHSTLIDAPAALRAGIDWPVKAMVAGAAPPAAMIAGMATMGFEVTHVYGLTEVYGPAAACAKHDDWKDLPLDDQVARNARQGARYAVQQQMTVIDRDTGVEVPADGQTIGEVVFRGNIVMKGYLKNPQATAEAFANGWFHTGDLGVRDPDGYVKLKDRAKDIIISGGENISSIELEDVIYRHPAVQACAVVAKPHERWGETPLAVVELRSGHEASADELIAHCRKHLAGFKCPREIHFAELPKTSTGKIQKHLLRERYGSSQAIG